LAIEVVGLAEADDDALVFVLPPPLLALSSLLSSVKLLYLSPVFVVLKSMRTPVLYSTPSNDDGDLRDGLTMAGVVNPEPVGYRRTTAVVRLGP
jgi:hypothetical protein